MPVFTPQRVLMGAGAGLVDPFMEEIETVTLASAAASVTFSGIDSAFRMFQLTGTALLTGSTTITMQFNADTGSNYDRQHLIGNSTTVSGSRVAANTAYLSTNQLLAGESGIFEVFIAKQAAGSPAMFLDSSLVYAPPGISAIVYQAGAYRWNNTADLISSIAVVPSSNNLAANSQLVLNGDRSASI